MAYNNNYLPFSISLIAAVLLLQLRSSSARPNVTAVFAFGDSILDPGNNNRLPATLFRADHPPYGLDFPGRVPTGRFSDGELPGDILVSRLGIKPLLPAYLDPALDDEGLLTGASFASAGTGLDDLTAAEAGVLSMKAQLEHFRRALGRMRNAVGREEAGRAVGDALFLVGAGTNDMLFNYYVLPLRRGYTVSQYHDLLLRSLEDVIRRLLSMGARRVAVMGLPPIGCLPVQVSLASSLYMQPCACVNRQNSDSEAYNSKLEGLISRLQQTSPPGSRIAYVDIFNPIMDIMKSPAQFGFERTLEGCCGEGALAMGPLCNGHAPPCPNPSKYVFWDAAHPTQATYTILSQHFLHNVLPTLLT